MERLVQIREKEREVDLGGGGGQREVEARDVNCFFCFCGWVCCLLAT